MNATPKETRAEYLARNIDELRKYCRELPCYGGVISDEETKCIKQITAMNAELNLIAPYRICQNGAVWVIAYKGTFLTNEDESEFLKFATQADADAWIDENAEVAA